MRILAVDDDPVRAGASDGGLYTFDGQRFADVGTGSALGGEHGGLLELQVGAGGGDLAGALGHVVRPAFIVFLRAEPFRTVGIVVPTRRRLMVTTLVMVVGLRCSGSGEA